MWLKLFLWDVNLALNVDVVSPIYFQVAFWDVSFASGTVFLVMLCPSMVHSVSFLQLHLLGVSVV